RVDAGEAGSVLAVVFAGTLPMAGLQASSTQNDLVAAFLLLGFIDRFLAWRVSRGRGGFLFSPASLRLARLTQGTVLGFGPPFALWMLVDLSRWSGGELRFRLGLVALAIGLALLPNLPHALRNMAAYGTPLGGPSASETTVARMSANGFAANLLRDAAMQFAMP